MPASVPTNAYANRVRADGARIYWPLNETSGATATDRAASGPPAPSAPGIGVTDGRSDGGVTWSQDGAITGDTAAAITWTTGRGLCPRHRDRARHVHGPDVDPHHHDQWRPDPRLQRPPERRLRPPRPSRLHGQRRPPVLRRAGPGRLPAHRLERPHLQRQPVAPGHGDDEPGRHAAVRRRRPRRTAQRHDRRRGLPRLLAARRRQPRGWPNNPSTRQLQRHGRRGRHLPDRAHTGPDPRPVRGQRPDVADPAGTGRRLWRGRVPGRARPLLAPRRDQRDDRRRLREVAERRHLPQQRRRPRRADAQPGRSSRARQSGGIVRRLERLRVLQRRVLQPDGVLGRGVVQDHHQRGRQDHRLRLQPDRTAPAATTATSTCRTTANSCSASGPARRTPSPPPTRTTTASGTTWSATQSGAGHEALRRRRADGHQPADPGARATPATGRSAETTPGAPAAPTSTAPSTRWRSTPTSSASNRIQQHFVLGGGKLNQAPTAAFTSTVEQRRVTFNATGSTDPDGTITSYAWDFGDGNTGTGATPVHVFAPGTHTVTLTVTDNRGGTGRDRARGHGHRPTRGRRRLRLSGHRPTAPSSSGASVRRAATPPPTRAAPSTRARTSTATPRASRRAAHRRTRRCSSTAPTGSRPPTPVYDNPTVYSEEAWFKTTTNRGGKIIGFGQVRDGNSNSYDRHVYMQDDGRLVLRHLHRAAEHDHLAERLQQRPVAPRRGHPVGLRDEAVRRRPAGRHQPADRRPRTTPGYWKVGGDITWGSSSDYFDGTIDEVAVYLSELSAERVAAHYAAAAAAPPANQPPTAEFTSTASNLDGGVHVDVDGRRRDDRHATAGTSVTARPQARWPTRRTPMRRRARTR